MKGSVVGVIGFGDNDNVTDGTRVKEVGDGQVEDEGLMLGMIGIWLEGELLEPVGGLVVPTVDGGYNQGLVVE